MPLAKSLQSFATHCADAIFPRALEILGGGSLLHHVGGVRASTLTAAEQRAARLCGWMLFPLPGVVVLHDQPLSGLPVAWARELAKWMLDGDHGIHRFTDPESHHAPPAAAATPPWPVQALPMEFQADDWAQPAAALSSHTLGQALGLQLPLQQHFARTEEARLRGLQAADLSRTKKLACCPSCKGSGGTRIHPHLRVACQECGGSGWARELQAVEERGLRWTELGKADLNQLQEHFAGTVGISAVLDLAVAVGMGEVPFDMPLSRLPRGCRRLAPILQQMAAGADVGLMQWAAPTEGLNLLEVERLLFTMVDFASTQMSPNWRDNHPVLAHQP